MVGKTDRFARRKWVETEKVYTLPETNIAPENGWLEDVFPSGKDYFQVLC